LGVVFAITGPPGVGKSTLVSKVVYRLKSAGVIVGGFTTAEKRSGGVRVGFKINDLTRQMTGTLASAESKIGPKVGRYRVNLTDLTTVGAAGLRAAAETSEVIVVDEVGPMELVSPEFKRGVRACLDSGKPMLVVLHERFDDDLLNALRSSATSTFALTVENRDSAADEIASLLLKEAGGPKTSVAP